jgi:hypothetical protein
MNFIVHDGQGRIVACGFCDPQFFSQYEGPDRFVMVSTAGIRPETHYVDLSGDPVITPIPAKPTEWHVFDYTTHTWVLSLEKAKDNRAALIDSACETQILSGFESDALGQPHHYPTKLVDQQNLSASVLASLLPDLDADWTTPFWCADTNGVWEFRPHTAVQIQQVGQDVKTGITTAQAKNEQLQGAIAAAESVAELEAITW